MGSYGIGITRIMAAAAEQSHDDDGLIWPKVMAPFDVIVVIATRDHEGTVAEAERIYAELGERGVDVILDDREESAGVKFKDADLIGYPVQVVVGKRGVEAGHRGPEAPRDRGPDAGADRRGVVGRGRPAGVGAVSSVP